ncbi:unnamed protein product [Rhizoctonia solani]|uniref:Cyclin N-terminal domain-containing protein n=1 Tax=Rhizoctonia solani TaxID=456999 RepID=A0A8H3BEJ5_9AGAM|nr:unnamed protein product [Rhizoctonia solani]
MFFTHDAHCLGHVFCRLVLSIFCSHLQQSPTEVPVARSINRVDPRHKHDGLDPPGVLCSAPPPNTTRPLCMLSMANAGARFSLPQETSSWCVRIVEPDWEADDVQIPKTVSTLNFLDMKNELTATTWICARFITIRFSCTHDPPATSHSDYALNLTGFIACALGLALEHARLPYSFAFYALRLLQRVKERHPSSYCNDGHRPFIAAFMVAAKYASGQIFPDKFWCHISQKLFGPDELNEIEEDFLSHLGWLRNVDPDDLCTFKARLRSVLSFPPSTYLCIKEIPNFSTMEPGKH